MSLQYDLFVAEHLNCNEAISVALSLAVYSRPSEKWYKLYGSKYKLVFIHVLCGVISIVAVCHDY